MSTYIGLYDEPVCPSCGKEIEDDETINFYDTIEDSEGNAVIDIYTIQCGQCKCKFNMEC